MKFSGYMSECIFVSGVYFLSNEQVPLGISFVILGAIAGLIRFVQISITQGSIENRKNKIYEDLKAFASGISGSISQASSDFQQDARGRRGNTIH